jgi:hypothetical protein
MIVNCRIIDKIITWHTTVLFSGTKLTGITGLSHTSTASERTVFGPRVLILRLFVLQARQTSRRRWVWRIDKMILKVRNPEVLGEKPVPAPLCPPKTLTCTDLGSKAGFRGVRPATDCLIYAWPSKLMKIRQTRQQSVPNSQDIPYWCCSTRKWSQFIVRISRSTS